MIRTAASAATRGDLQTLQRALGTRWDPEGALFCPASGALLSPSRIAYDKMRVLLSHGVAGRELAGLCGELAKLGVTADHMDRFARTFTAPRSFAEKEGRPLPEGFFSNRLRDDGLKGSAREVLAAVGVACGFCVATLVPPAARTHVDPPS